VNTHYINSAYNILQITETEVEYNGQLHYTPSTTHAYSCRLHTHTYHSIAPHCMKRIAEQSKCGTTTCHTYPQTNMKLLICTSSK